MTYSHNSPTLTATQQGALSKALSEVITARNSETIDNYWTCLETLYMNCLGLSKGSNELEKKIEPIYTKFKATTILSSWNKVRDANNKKWSTWNYKTENADKIYKTIIKSLRDNGYSEAILGATPRSKDQPHIGEE